MRTPVFSPIGYCFHAHIQRFGRIGHFQPNFAITLYLFDNVNLRVVVAGHIVERGEMARTCERELEGRMVSDSGQEGIPEVRCHFAKKYLVQKIVHVLEYEESHLPAVTHLDLPDPGPLEEAQLAVGRKQAEADRLRRIDVPEPDAFVVDSDGCLVRDG